MPLHARINQYVGVNAHLQSAFQSRGGWSSFHNNYIRDLAVAIDTQLPQGYLVDVEQSLQIREYHPDTGERLRRPQLDITIFDESQGTPRQGMPVLEGVSPATLTRPVLQTIVINADVYYPSLVIYRQEPDSDFGEAVTRIELLSPSNKQGNGEVQYREKRIATLRSGVQLVEIDLLHETPSPVLGLAAYPQGDNAFPYTIIISNPRPSIEEGFADIYGFRVEEPMPIIPIPLNDNEAIALDPGAAYNATFRSLAAYSRRVDYEQLPDHFDSYHAIDQEQIQARMQTVQSATDLSTGPLSLNR